MFLRKVHVHHTRTSSRQADSHDFSVCVFVLRVEMVLDKTPRSTSLFSGCFRSWT